MQDISLLPQLATHVWIWFCDMSRDRQYPERITPEIMRDFEWIMDIEMEAWERKAIRRLDQSYINQEQS